MSRPSIKSAADMTRVLHVLAFFGVIMSGARGQTTNPYCSPSTPYSSTNPSTYPLSNASFTETPSSATSSQLSTSQPSIQTYITSKHNCLRSSASPPASNMLKMSWDSEAAAQAQAWANNCVYAHNAAADRTTSKFACGQNIAMSTGFALSWHKTINLWYNEANIYAYFSNSNDFHATGHYTQIVWATSFLVGCGWTSCPARNGNSAFNFYVCNYCPAGNVQNSNGVMNKPYVTGTPCASCSGSCEQNRLCTNSCAYTDAYSNCAQLDAQAKICTPGTQYYSTYGQSCRATCLCKGKITSG